MGDSLDQNGAGRARLGVRDLLLLGVPAVWAGFRIVVRNLVGIPHLERLIVVSVVLWTGALAVSVGLIRFGIQRRVAVYATFIAAFVFLGGGGLMRAVGPLAAWVLAIGAVAVMAVLAFRASGTLTAEVAVYMIAFALVSGLAIDLTRSITQYRNSEMATGRVELALKDSRDIFLVVLDGFPGLESLSTSFGADFVDDLRANMSELGFELPTAWTAYPSTNFSIPSILAMDYPLESQPSNRKTLQDLYDVISGDNALREAAEEGGFTTHMVESGWSGSSCRSWYDRCVASSWFDDPMYFLVWSSLIAEYVMPGEAYQYALGSKASMQWLEANVPELSSNANPDFVFAHVVAPHPPLYLERDCQIIPSPRRAGFFFNEEGVPPTERKMYLEGQLECVMSFMRSVAGQLDPNDILVFVSDHGTDLHGQLTRDPRTWSEAEVMERMNAFVAARLPEKCSMGEEIYLPNVMRVVGSCVSEEDLPLVEGRMFLFTKDWTR